MADIAIVEDNPDLLRLACVNLLNFGLEVAGFSDGKALDNAIDQGNRWSILLLDLGLPGEDGLSIANRIKKTFPELHIVALTAIGHREARISAINSNFDQYFVKPVDYEELAVHLKAILRRLNIDIENEPIWEVDRLQQSLTLPDGNFVQLSFAEIEVLQLLAASLGDPVDREKLIMALERNPMVYDPRALEVFISRLRKKLGGDFNAILPVRNHGYRLVVSLKFVN